MKALIAELETERQTVLVLNNKEAEASQKLNHLIGGAYEPLFVKEVQDRIKELQANIEEAEKTDTAERKTADDLQKRFDSYSASVSDT